MRAKIVLLAGDGIGPEVVAEGRATLEAVASMFGHELSFEDAPIGGFAIDATGDPLPDATLAACRSSDAVVLGAVGGPKWDDPRARVRPEQGLLRLRKELGLYANLRPVRSYKKLMGASPLKPDRLEGVDFVVVRELTSGLYFGEPRRREREGQTVRAIDTLAYTDAEIRRIVELSFRLASGRRKKLASIDKANVLETSRLWREIAVEVGASFPDVSLSHQLVDSTAMRLVTAPADYDVIVTENMFGDILSDEAAVIAGSLGLLPSASLGEGKLGVYEPIHGSAPDIAGRGVANPIGTILSVAMLLRHSLGLEREARAIEQAVERTIDAAVATRDLGGSASTRQMGEAIRASLRG